MITSRSTAGPPPRRALPVSFRGDSSTARSYCVNIMRYCALVVFLFGAHLAMATPSTTQAANRPAPSRDPNRRPTDYQIGAGDVLRIITWKEADFSGSFLVRYDGKITIPFVGDVLVAAQTPSALSTKLDVQIGHFVDLARVTVAIEEPNRARFFVLGKVAQQGAFPYTSLDSHGAVRT